MPLQSLLFTMNLFSNRVGKGGGIFALEGRDEVKNGYPLSSNAFDDDADGAPQLALHGGTELRCWTPRGAGGGGGPGGAGPRWREEPRRLKCDASGDLAGGEDGVGKGHDSADGHEDEVEHGGVDAGAMRTKATSSSPWPAASSLWPAACRVELLDMRWASMAAGAAVLAHPRRRVRMREQPPRSYACATRSPTGAAVLGGPSFVFAVGKGKF